MKIPSFILSESNRQARGFTKSYLWHVRSVRRHLMFQRISFFKAENVRIDRTADGTGRRSFLIGRTIRKLGGQMFTQIFTPMTWHNSSGSCTRGAATCTTWLLDIHAARIVHFDRKPASHQFTRTAAEVARIILRRQHLFSRHSTIIQHMRPQWLEPFILIRAFITHLRPKAH